MEKKVVVFGPHGSDAGAEWDDGMNDTVKKVIIHSGLPGGVIDAIQVEYVKNGKDIMKPKHGGPGGNAHVITLDYPAEYLISLSGYCGIYSEQGGHPVVHSLTLKSNIREFDTYGTKKGTPFASPQAGYGKIIGFMGKSGTYLNSIGAYFDLDE